ncbi:Asp-tRNA(Asn)/Glu-tRNA(Gln) amidotransferase subunit GatB [Limosilactobacillus fermentum]|nr:Asp-tRNA(Asn)/Glu-tRNA(Gln) amidotransferase subunit GatB [Limosilactobacillus fermentum]
MNFETTIGLEVHVELKTNSKIFSPSPVNFGAAPNANTNVIDWGYPGVLPSINKGVVRDGIMAALALHAEVTKKMHFDRKNYFYPDNPKAYQITQSETPIAHDGLGGNRIRRQEEKDRDQGNAHRRRRREEHPHRRSLLRGLEPAGDAVDRNSFQGRHRFPEEAVAYLEALRQRIQFTGISDVKMEEGSMRVDTNISVRPYGSDQYGTKTEMKNINSFNFVKNALNFEADRHQKVLMAGGEIVQETRRYDEATKGTVAMRTKEGSDDYRYFPEPDLPPLEVDDAWIEEIRSQMPEMPGERRRRYVNDLGLTDYDAMVLTQTKEMADFFEEAVKDGGDAKKVANYLMNDVNSYLNNQHVDLDDTKLTPANLAGMIKLIDDGTISSKMAKKVFQGILDGQEPAAFAKANGLVQLSDPAELQPIIDAILDDNEQSIEDFKNGKDRAFGFLIGQIMKKTQGKANPKVVNQLLGKSLNER